MAMPTPINEPAEQSGRETKLLAQTVSKLERTPQLGAKRLVHWMASKNSTAFDATVIQVGAKSHSLHIYG